MIKIFNVLFLGLIMFSSCNELNNREKSQNQLVVTANGDTLENGFWTYDKGKSGVSGSGNYTDGFKTGKWIYKSNNDSLITNWSVIKEKGIKFNYPDYLKLTNEKENPTIFLADIVDNDDNTYITLLRYNLTQLKTSEYDYLYSYNEAIKNYSTEKLKSKEFKKMYFKGIELYRVKIQTEKKIKYELISYIFVVNDFLYELAYKNSLEKSNAITLEIFNDLLYSMECEGIDLFNYYNNKFYKEENIEFKSDTLQK